MFKSQNFCHIASNNRNNVKAGMFIYRTTDDLATVTANGYFNDRIIDLNLHDIIVHEQIDNADPTKVKQNFLCVVQKTLTNVNTKIMDTDEVDGADTDLSNLTSTGANIANWSSNVSNCITEIPQDINLYIDSSYNLVLNAGSNVYTGDGIKITTANNITYPAASSQPSFKFLIFINTDGTALNIASLSTAVSAATNPGGPYRAWFNTTDRKCYINDSSENPIEYSLPIAIVTHTNGTGWTSIDQVFNGFGYISSTVFALPGVKGLSPNGRNADRTLKTSPWATSSIIVRTFTDTNNTDLVFNGTTFEQGTYHLGSDGYLYNSANVLIVSTVIGTLNRTAGKITSLTPKTVFHAVDYSDTGFIGHQAMPSDRYTDLTLPTSGGTITAPADGYITVQKAANADGQYVAMINNTNGANVGMFSTENLLNLRLLMPVSQGDVLTINYTAAGATAVFRLIYANGAQ